MEKELLQQALDSILHGSTQIVSSQDAYGNLQSQEVRINDLRVPLVEKLASKLVQTEGFKLALEKAFTQEVMAKIIKQVIETMKYGDLPYQLKNSIEAKLKVENVSMQKFKMVIEAVEKEV